MDPNERKGWMEVIGVEDLDSHMAAIGQVQANAEIVKQMFEDYPLRNGAKLLIAGCGTGQLFDYLKPSDLGNLELTLTDINPPYLSATEQRLRKFGGVKYNLKIDDIEATNLQGHYDGILIVLVLQHVEYKKALASMLSLNPSRFYIIEQEQDTTQHAVAKGRKLTEAWKKYAEMANPQLIQRKELTGYLKEKGYVNIKVYEREVPDNKRMVGFVFEK